MLTTKYHRSLGLLILIAVMALVTSGCGARPASETGADAPAAPVAQEETQAEAVEEEAVVEEPVAEEVVAEEAPAEEAMAEEAMAEEDTRGVLAMLATSSNLPQNFNPVLLDVRLWLYDGLVRFDTDLKPIPDLAESWEISDDGLVYTFHLREGVKFHDGEEMTADDVVYTAELFLDENNNSPYRNKFIIGEEPVKWEKIDDYTVQATLPQPSSSFLAKTSRADEIFFTILPKHILEKCDNLETCDEFNQHPIGTGPFKLVEYVPDQRVVEEAFDDYFQGKPGVRQVIRLALPNEQSALAALKSGEIDVATLREAGNVNAADDDPNLTVYRYDSNWIMIARFNMANPILEDIRVRQAIAHAVDRENLVKAAVGPTAKPGNSPINVGWAANPDIEGLAYDPELAKSLLDEAGWVPGSDGIRTKDGQTLSLSILFQEGSGRPELATGMQQFLKEVGIDLQLQQLETATFDETVFQNKDFDMYLNWDGFGVDPDVASRWLTSTAEEGTYLSNPSSYSNSEVDTLFAEAQVASTLEERQEKLWEATKMIADDVPAVWLYLYEAQMAVSNNVDGLSLPPSTADMDNTAIFREPWKVTSKRPYIE